MAPTEAGARLLARLAPALHEVVAAVDAVHEADGVVAGLLRINAPAPAADLVIAPLLAPFLARLPRVRVEVVVAAPTLLAARGTPTHPRELRSLPCIRLKFPSGRLIPWEFEHDGERVLVDPEGPLVATHGPLLLRAALDGAGFASTFEGYVEEHLASGRLARVLDHWLPWFPGPRLYFPSRRQLPPPLRAFVEFVRARNV